MDLQQFLHEDILAYLERQEAILSAQNRGSKIRAMDDEFGLFIQRDYSKELTDALDVNNKELAKKIFIEAEESFERAPEGSNEREALRRILEELAIKIRLFASNQKYQRNLSEIIKTLEERGIFTKTFLTRTKEYLHHTATPQKISQEGAIVALRAIMSGESVDANLHELHKESQDTREAITSQSTAPWERPTPQQESAEDQKALEEMLNWGSAGRNEQQEPEVAATLNPPPNQRSVQILAAQAPTMVRAEVDVNSIREQIRKQLKEELKTKDEEIEQLREAQQDLELRQAEIIERAKRAALETIRQENQPAEPAQPLRTSQDPPERSPNAEHLGILAPHGGTASTRTHPYRCHTIEGKRGGHQTGSCRGRHPRRNARIPRLAHSRL
ncbi:MAG: hypothetical protein HC945_01010 [Nitrosarchaeum sp.]|nr:hypothetical protein [Nitrosarchaeum sp.]